ncbi:MAG TPA: imidazole glycerol phosphate synthase subunit HisH [Leptospiraceae bacterium]|nr:imidazole glycerol phosphate synthase subunit HisH [Leptospiraceae bacterium]
MIAVIDFGMGNIHSCLKAVSLYTEHFELVTDPAKVKNAAGIILPGDGAFSSAMKNLEERGFKDILIERVNAGVPLFGICIGFQILFTDSDETFGRGLLVSGLNLIRGHVRRFQGKNGYKVPHMGWNQLILNNRRENKILQNIPQNSYMYFIHSYRPVDVESGVVLAQCSYYNEKFAVVVEKKNIFGTQFHPEKSDKVGLKILENFIRFTDI